jgi:UDP-3-O-[3-hydroxymyristoyl] N-acetylglucosamine deacetylase
MNERKSVRWEGKGLHTGNPCTVEVVGGASPGLCFTFPGGEVYRVEEAKAVGDGRGSTLFFPNGITIRTVEHLLSALAGLGIWDAEIRVEGGEVPALDGSAERFSQGLVSLAGTERGLKSRPLRVDAPVSVRDSRRKASLVVLPAESFGVSCVIDYPETWIGTQAYFCEQLDRTVYLEEIAKARTFCLDSEIEALQASGLGKGGDPCNTVIIGENGPLNPQALAYPDGCVRHKVLDLIGDLALLGRPVVGHFIALRSGHGLHLSLVSRLRRILEDTKAENRT